MKVRACHLALAACVFFGAPRAFSGEAPECRVWKDRKGASVEGVFLKSEGEYVFLRRSDGQTVQAKLENLCEEDRAYVADLTYVPREVVAVFKKHILKDRFDEEVGQSEKATWRDTVVLRTVEGVPGAAPAPQADTRWKIESVDSLGNRLLPRLRSATNEWVIEGCFVFVTYTVKNESAEPATVTHPVLSDTQGRKFHQSERAGAAAFLPEGSGFADRDAIRPGEAKLFCSIYEAAHDSVPASVEVYPSKTGPHFVRRAVTLGKQILLDAADASSQAAR
jgi:hypothetical protein